MLVGEESNLGERCVRLMRVFAAGEKERVRERERQRKRKRAVRCRVIGWPLLSGLFAAHKSLLTSAISRRLLARHGLTHYVVRNQKPY